MKCTNCGNDNPATPVSYTHLDVYKRQPKRPMRSCWSRPTAVPARPQRGNLNGREK